MIKMFFIFSTILVINLSQLDLTLTNCCFDCTISVTDLTFSTSMNGKHIPFGSAGDCYSAAECPQGQFRINLSGTGLAVVSNTTWVSQGTNATQRISRLQVRGMRSQSSLTQRC